MKQQVRNAIAKLNRHCNIACLGLAFKPDIDDLRESPSVFIARDLAKEYPGCVMAVEPNITELPEIFDGTGLRLVSAEEALKADIILLLVDHREFRSISPDFDEKQILIDTRGLWRK